ncbi:MAG TPA: nitroreductase family protein [Bryobacteraceae bacterium]|nr:nitroreductase family protein [Bryobacteraceae bacterium]
MPIKSASPDHEILELIKERWSPRAFSSRRPDIETLNRLFEAARWAASSDNEQPWRYLVARAEDGDRHETLASCLFPGNAWARKAPVLAMSVAARNFAKTGKLNRVALHDVGAASALLTLQGMSMGVFVHQMAGFDTEKARQVCQIPPDYDPVAMMALGYPGDPESLSEPLRTRELSPRERRPVREFVFSSTFGEPPAL